jgi:hypothetical protein
MKLCVLTFCCTLLESPAWADPVFFNSVAPGENASTQAAWLAAVGVGAPQFLVNFETGFVNGQNISGVGGLFPLDLIIRDLSSANQVIIRSGARSIQNSNPVGVFSATHNDLDFLELDFSANPVDYVSFQDIDHHGITGLVFFEGGGFTELFIEETGGFGDSAEFFGIYRNDMPKITRVLFDASGAPPWGVDTIQYGIDSPGEIFFDFCCTRDIGDLAIASVPEPSTLTLLGAALLSMLALRRSR